MAPPDPLSADRPAGARPRPGSAARTSAWAPLRVVAFRNLWLALLASNIGTWMQTVGAQWLLIDVPGSTTLVALVQTASTLPILLLALPAGALADSLDKRRMLIGVQLAMVAVGVMLVVLTAAHRMAPSLLLTLTFGLGVGQALTIPAWQAMIPDMVARPQLPSASALGAISQNLARAVGPAIAGLVIARAGVAAVFALNMVSYAIFAAVLWLWRPPPGEIWQPERFGDAIRAGGRYVRHSPVVRRLMLRSALFVLPASALWALLPLVASRNLGLGSGGYGLLLGALGVGAIAGAVLMPRVRMFLSTNAMLGWAGLVYASALITVALVRVEVVVLIVLLAAGGAWVTVLSSINATLQLFLPGWVRARGLSIYQIVFAAGLGLGSLLWGGLGQLSSLGVAHLAAAAVMLVGVAGVRIWPLHDITTLSRAPAVYWPEPILEHEPHPRAGPVLVTVSYTVVPERQPEFIEAIQRVRRSRQRSGAIRWGLYREGERANRFVEVYVLRSWEEHLRQHGGRLTATDREAEEYVRSLTSGPVDVAHLISADPDDE